MRIFGIIVAALIGLTILSITMRGCNDAATTVNKEFNASALLKKYEGFKNLSAAIDEKRAEIEMYQSEIQEMSQNKAMDKEDKFYYQQRKSELIGIISTHNRLCADYNSAMSKFNYSFTNTGDLPATNLEPLPREIKPYINNLNSK
jgi:uncharacterized protein YqgQ